MNDCFTKLENKLILSKECLECGRKYCKDCEIKIKAKGGNNEMQ